ncbi:ABC transporter permease [bacterium]|nr:ABC transporter permease [bacterium]
MNPRARVGLAGLLFFLVVALLGPWFIGLDRMPNYEARFAPISLAHWLGTDYAGRDVLAQLVHGSRDILTIAFSTGLFAVLLALLIGVGGALAGGIVDAFLLACTDVFLTVPSFPLMAILSALFRVGDPITFGLLLALWSWPGLARSLRGQVLSLQQREFIEVCRLMRMGTWHILWREILPNLVPYLTLNFILIARNAITASVGIMMLGLVPLRVENWGMMLNLAAFQSGAIFLPQGQVYLLAPLLAIVLFQYSLILFAGGVEEIFDPRLRRS